MYTTQYEQSLHKKYCLKARRSSIPLIAHYFDFYFKKNTFHPVVCCPCFFIVYAICLPRLYLYSCISFNFGRLVPSKYYHPICCIVRYDVHVDLFRQMLINIQVSHFYIFFSQISSMWICVPMICTANFAECYTIGISTAYSF